MRYSNKNNKRKDLHCKVHNEQILALPSYPAPIHISEVLELERRQGKCWKMEKLYEIK